MEHIHNWYGFDCWCNGIYLSVFDIWKNVIYNTFLKNVIYNILEKCVIERKCYLFCPNIRLIFGKFEKLVKIWPAQISVVSSKTLFLTLKNWKIKIGPRYRHRGIEKLFLLQFPLKHTRIRDMKKFSKIVIKFCHKRICCSRLDADQNEYT